MMVPSPTRAEARAIQREALTGVVVCGGRSVRMGRDKAAIEFGGKTLLERAVEALDPLCSEVLLASGSAPRFPALGRREVLDAAPDCGPLAGLVAALEASRTEWLIALACDMPGVDTRVLEELARVAQEDGWDVTMLGTPSGPEPLCAVYRSSCAAPARAALRAGRVKLTDFHTLPSRPALRVLTQPTERFSDALRGAVLESARNLNTPEDLERALARARHDAPKP